MTPAQVRRRYQTIMKHQRKWHLAYKALQEECLHPKSISKRDSSTGNWDRGDDCYWIKHYCPDCDKRWTEDQ
jgi:hypothetical protein